MDPPFLSKLSSAAWYGFVEAWKAYKSRGGERKLRDLISEPTWRLLELRLRLRGDGCVEGDVEVIASVNRMFAPATLHEA